MRARILGALTVGLCAVPFMAASLGACGDDSADGAFGGGGGGTTTTQSSTAFASSGSAPFTTSSSASTTTTTTGTQSGGGEGGAGGDGGSSSEGGSTSEGGATAGEGGSGGAGGGLTGVGGGVVDVACVGGAADGCVPFPSDGGGGAGGAGDLDCDDDGDPNETDCQPCDPAVYHGQTQYFDEPFTPFEDGADPSFDYDCSGSASFEYASQEDGCTAFDSTVCPDEPIYTSDDPACGEEVNLQACTVSGLLGVLGSCDNDGNATVTRAACH